MLPKGTIVLVVSDAGVETAEIIGHLAHLNKYKFRNIEQNVYFTALTEQVLEVVNAHI